MKYCRVVIECEQRGRVYQRDFEALHLFGLLVRAYASELVTQGVVREGEHYISLIHPRYEDTMIQNGLVQVNSALTAEDYASWLNLAPLPAHADDPLRFFTIELRFRESGVIYTQDLRVLSLDTFWVNLQNALLHMHVLTEGETYMPRLFMRDDDEADFEREQFTVRNDGDAPLVELIEVVEDTPAFPTRSLVDFEQVEVKTAELISTVELAAAERTGLDEVRVLIKQDALAELQEIARQDVQVEQGGMLVGHIYETADPGGKFLVVITNHLEATGASANLVELRYTFDAWLNQTNTLKERFPGKQIVGWYHTHLIKAEFAGEDDQTYATEFFFSQDDRFMHRRFFRDPYYVAMVLNPRGEAAFFRWFGDKISSNRQYYVIN